MRRARERDVATSASTRAPRPRGVMRGRLRLAAGAGLAVGLLVVSIAPAAFSPHVPASVRDGGGRIAWAQHADSDGDGCQDGEELGENPMSGGGRDPDSPWDFFDVPAPAGPDTGADGRLVLTSASVRNKTVSLQDVSVVLSYVGRIASNPAYIADNNGDTIPDGQQLDRTPSANAAKLWQSGPPSGAISLQDVQVGLAQVGHDCTPELAPVFTETQIASSLGVVTAMEFAPDGRLFVAKQTGTVYIIREGFPPATFMTLTVDSYRERGLMGITFHPNFPTDPYVYLYYTVPGTPELPVHNRVSRFTVSGDVVVPGSEEILFELDPLSASGVHIGGALHFAPDGRLFVASGDSELFTVAQELTNLHGKMLRLNADGSIPAENPFVADTTGNNRAIFARGFRNPYTAAIDPLSSVIYVNDVGGGTWEEINELLAGANYGWPTCEGSCANPSFTNPIYQYATVENGQRAAITGGVFYHGSQFPAEYDGDYFFSDYVRDWIKRRDAVTGAVTDFRPVATNPVDLDVGPLDGALYYLNVLGGVYKITAD